MFDKIFKKNESKSMSRLKKKLFLYFILIAIVSISVSAQIILEVSSKKFNNDIRNQYVKIIDRTVNKKQLVSIMSDIEEASSGSSNKIDIDLKGPIKDMRNRMILLLFVISMAIIGAFNLFTKDIVVPMDGLVDATKKLADGDLTAHIPVMSEDEIGQMAGLVNDMNINLQDMIKQIKTELDGNNFKIALAVDHIHSATKNEISQNVIKNKKIKISQFKKILDASREVEKILNEMSNNLTSLHSFIDSYHTYSIPSEITQKEIDETLRHYDKT